MGELSEYKPFKMLAPSAYLEKEEVWRIINAIPQASKHPERDMLILRTMWETGGRVTEVIQLQADQIVEESCSMFLVNLKRQKKVYKEPYVSPSLVSALLNYCKVNRIKGGEYVFKGNRNPNTYVNRCHVWRVMNKAAIISGVSKSKPIKGRTSPAWPHLLRHGCAMHILDRTGSTEKAQRQLGHSSIVTTQVYATLKLRQEDREISNLDWE